MCKITISVFEFMQMFPNEDLLSSGLKISVGVMRSYAHHAAAKA